MSVGIPILGSLVDGVVGIFKAKQVRKAASESAKSKIEAAVLDNQNSLNLNDAEWENIKAAGEPDSWKDEYVTILITSPILLILVGGLYAAFTGDARILEGIHQSLIVLKSMEIDMGFLMQAVVMAAIGLKVWRRR